MADEASENSGVSLEMFDKETIVSLKICYFQFQQKLDYQHTSKVH
jgi:hypothetical protein